MSTRFIPVTLDLIDEGEFVEGINAELEKATQAITAYCREHGDKAHKAKAKLKIEIEMCVVNAADGAYSIKNTIKTEHPGRPSSVSLAVGGEDERGQGTLFVRGSGSDQHHPRQAKLATRDGRVIDPVSGEPLDS